MFLHDLGSNGKSEPRTAIFGGIKRQKQSLAYVFSKAVPGVRDRHLNRSSIFAEGTADAEHAEQASMHGLCCIVDEVGKGAPDGFRIGQHCRQTGLQVTLYRDAFE